MNALRQISNRSEFQGLARFLGISRILKEAYYRAWAPSDGTFQVNLGGVDVRLRACSGEEWWGMESLHSGGTECFFEALIPALRQGDVFYDIGSNIGEYAVAAAKTVGSGGHVVACEPIKSNYERIQAHLLLNGLTNVRAYQVALAEGPGKMELQLSGFLGRHSRLAGEGTVWGNRETVEVRRGDELRESEGLPFPNAVKIDVEGYEYHVLKGMKHTLVHPSCRLLCCEVHPSGLPAPLTPEHVVEAIKELGFTSIETVDRGSEVHLICRKESSSHASF